MPKIDLPPDSLGPKPTVQQLELLTKMATSGATVRTWTGVRMDSGGAYIDYHVPNETKHEKFRENYVSKFVDWGWLESTKDGDWRGHNYVVSDRGRKVIEKGETRGKKKTVAVDGESFDMGGVHHAGEDERK